MESNELKRSALENALKRVDSIIDCFESSVRKEPVKKLQERDFSKVSSKLYPSETPAVKDVKGQECTDERLNMSLVSLKKDALTCSRCGLCKTRHSVVFGEGCETRPDVMVIGEAPGENEDSSGRPFVGAAGQFLDKWLASISLFRDKNCYISNIIKCRPPQNRDPLDEEKEACFPFIKQQIEIINPRAILCLGKSASLMITGHDEMTMASLHGRFFMYNKTIPVMCTYHPAAVLRDMSKKFVVWEDLKKLASFLNLEVNGAKK